MSQQGDFQGFLNVKIPSSIKSRSFIPWKAWKRQWVAIRRSRNNRTVVELLIGRNSQTVLQISVDDIICRTESRTQLYAFGIFPRQNKRRATVYLAGISETDSQKWIATIRKILKPPLMPVEENEFTVSVIDNFFSRSSGLAGLYGTLRMSPEKVTIVDPFTSKNKAEWPWATLSQFHVSSTVAHEDKGRICTIVTSRSFPSGVGPIHLFCTDSPRLAGKLKSKGRNSSSLSSPDESLMVPYRHHTFSSDCSKKSFAHLSASQATLRKESPPSRDFLHTRRLSRSEGNLLTALDHAEILYGCATNSCDSQENFPFDAKEFLRGKRKVAPGIISAGLGLILSTPGGSEGDTESLHEYQSLQNEDSNDELTSLSLIVPTTKFSPPRRESGVSIASGVYEEIDDVSIDLHFSSLDIVAETDLEPPPPLPPRRNLSCRNINEEDIEGPGLQVPRHLHRFLSRSAGNSPLSSPPSLSEPRSSNELLPRKPSSWNGDGGDDDDDCDYLPMLPGCGFLGNASRTTFSPKETMEDQHYMVMASIKGA